MKELQTKLRLEIIRELTKNNWNINKIEKLVNMLNETIYFN